MVNFPVIEEKKEDRVTIDMDEIVRTMNNFDEYNNHHAMQTNEIVSVPTMTSMPLSTPMSHHGVATCVPYCSHVPCAQANIKNVEEEIDHGTTLNIDPYENIMYVKRVEEKNGRKEKHIYSLFCHGHIKEVIHIKLSEEYGDPDCYMIEAQPANKNLPSKKIYLPGKEYGRPNMINKLIKEGELCFVGNHSDAKRADIIINKIVIHLGITEEFLNYCSGFYNGKFIYKNDPDLDYHVDAPINWNVLVIGKTDKGLAEDFKELFEIMKKYDSPNILLLLIYMVYSLTYTIFNDLKYKINKLLVLTGKGAESAADFLQICHKGKGSKVIGLNNNIPALKKYIFNSKDEVLIFKGSCEKLNWLRELFCDGEYPEVKINNKHFTLIPKSVCAVISNNVSEYLSSDYVEELEFNNNVQSLEPTAFGRVV